MNETKNKIIQAVQHYREIAASKGYHLPVIPIDFTLKGACAGQAVHKKWTGTPVKLRFNLELAHRNVDEFIRRTVPHECSHLLQFMRNPRSKPHGHEWDFFCRVLTGSTMPRCHSYDTEGLVRRRNVKRYDYACDCGTSHKVSATVHNRIINGKNYTCIDCGSRIRQIIAKY